MGLKLYGLPISTCTTRALACLYEKQVDDFELVPVNLFTAEHLQPPFLSKNPFGQIPALEDGDLTLFESRAISTYIAEKYKENGTDLLRHRDLKEAALVKVWMEVEAHQFNPAIQPIIYQYFVAPIQGNSPDQTIIDANLEKLGKVLDIYDERLRSTKYLAGDYYTLADLHHLPYTHYFMTTPYATLVDSRPNVRAWWEDISSRPAFKKVSENMKYGEN